MTDEAVLIRDKYEGTRPSDEELGADLARLAEGEPLAYVIGWIPFLGLRIRLDSHPLIPRPETEWWTNGLVAHLQKKFGSQPFSFLDLCAGSGAIGLAILKEFPNAHVSFAELMPEHAAQIQENIKENALDAAHADVFTSDLFSALPAAAHFDITATNPPYIPSARSLDISVIEHEPLEALFAGTEGLGIIMRIAQEVHSYMNAGGELWMECDIDNIGIAKTLLDTYGAERSEIRTDQYGRERFVVSYYP